MRLLLSLILAYIVAFPCIQAQTAVRFSYHQLVQQLEESAKAGQKRALRDLGSLLDKGEVQEQVRRVLLDKLVVSKEEFDLTSSFSKKDFLAFYYENELKFRFSEVTQTYFISPLYEHKVAYKTQNKEVEDVRAYNIELRRNIDAFSTLLKEGNTKTEQILDVLENICSYDKEEVFHFLLNLIAEAPFKKWKSSYRLQAYRIISKALVNYQEIESLNALLYILKEKHITVDFAGPLLTSISNIRPKAGANTEQLIQTYEYYIDSLGNLEAMRIYGYERLFHFQLSFFEFPVDYFGKILSVSDAYPWIQYNAYRDLIRSAHPRALFYLAAHMYKYRNQQPVPEFIPRFADQLAQLTRLEIGVQDQQGGYTFQPFGEGDHQAKRNFLVYWSKHYDDYEWDDNHGYFTNKKKAEEITQNYERLFRRLNSKNDSVAFKSFLQLTEGDATEVIELARKYRQLLRTYNSKLPSFKHKYLEQLVLLTNYCKAHHISYHPAPKIAQLTDQLLTRLAPDERYKLENTLLQNITLQDITTLEYITCINEKNRDFSFSISRVLDYYYSKNWEQIISDDEQLLLYLKKSYLFANIGVFGSSNYYLSKFDGSLVDLQPRLTKLYRLESDEDILNQISQLIAEPEDDSQLSFNLSEFLEEPALFSKRDIKTLPAPKSSDYRKIVKLIQVDDDISNIKNLFYYIRLHPDIDMVPYLFELIDDQRIMGRYQGTNVSIADNIVPSLEDIYHYTFEKKDSSQLFTTAQWANLWKVQGKDYQQWGRRFFEEKLQAIQQLETLTIEDVNRITESQHYAGEYKTRCLNYLKKVRPIKDIRKLNIEPALSVIYDLPHFEDFYFGYKELDDLPKLFEITIDNAGQMLDYLKRKSANFEISEQGSFYNNLFRYPWFVNYVSSSKAQATHIQSIMDILVRYLEESDYLSEYEEQSTNLHIAQLENLGKPIAIQLQASLSMNADINSQVKFQESIIAAVQYSDLATIAEFFKVNSDQITSKTFRFLPKDFGLPIYNLTDPEVMDLFIMNHQNMPEEDLYLHYLKQFGVDFLTPKGKLDFQKVYDILEFDIVTPFVSRSGGKRDYYIYGIIKVLELHFNTRLGFHQKLNENQTFYSFSSAKRAEAWRAYLIENKLVKFKNQPVSSFSHVRNEF